MARILLVDGTFELYRAHYSPRPSRVTPQGRDVKATYGVMGSMRMLLKEHAEHDVHVAIAFDNPIRSFRNDLFAGYKSDEGVPSELRGQFDLVEEATRALGIVTWSMHEFEADDAIGTAVARWSGKGHEIHILSPDKDMGQCLQSADVTQTDRIRKTTWGTEGVRAKLGVEPTQVPDYLALVGDPQDGIPGLPGYGPKAAAALLAEFGTLDAIPDDAAKWPKAVRGRDRLAPLLAEAREAVLLYRTLATLRTDVPLAETLPQLRYRGPDEAALAVVEAKLEAAPKP